MVLEAFRVFYSYLCQKTQKVGLKACFSGVKSIFAGVSQG